MTKFGCFPFEALDEEGEARAAELHESSVIVDMLFHGPTGYQVFTEEMTASVEQNLRETGDRFTAWEFGMEVPERMALKGDLPEFRQHWDESGLTGGTRDLFWHTPDGALAALSHTQALLDGFPWLGKALKADDFRSAHARGEHVQFLASQHAGRFGGRIEYMKYAYELGLRMLLVTYNENNDLGGGCTAPENLGLTPFGREVISFMNDQGIIVDTAHSGSRTTIETCKMSQAPVLASHTGAYGVYKHDRNKSDEELDAIASTGGIVGVFAVPVFLSGKPEPTIEDYLDHVDYIVNRIGVEHVGIGLDWPLQLPKWALENVTQPATLEGSTGWRKEHQLNDKQNLIGFDDYRDLPNITRGLVARGYSDTAIRAILGENFLRVFETVVG